MTTAAPSVEAIRALAPLIRDHAESIEAERRLPEPVVRALAEADVFRLLVPRKLGGAEADPVTACRILEELSYLDGSVGWCAMIGSEYGFFAGLLPEEAAREIYADARSVVAGTFKANGTARAVDGGYRVSGQFGFGSGITHSRWTIGGFRLYDGDAPRLKPGGAPDVRVLFVPTSDVEVADTWHVAGMRGTGSHDYAVNDVLVPAHRAVWFTDEPAQPGPLYTLPGLALFVALMATVPLGIARHALDALRELALVKTPSGADTPLRDNPHAQARIGEAEGLLRAGRAFLYETVEEVWDAASHGRRISWEQRGLLWLAASQATTQALQAVDLMFRVGGASSIYASLPLERCLRDIRAAAQHRVIQPINFELAGRMFLGLDVAKTLWGVDDRRDA
jgi:alkylation response protein AidB-like acyl-CoA dehydrogenase